MPGQGLQRSKAGASRAGTRGQGLGRTGEGSEPDLGPGVSFRHLIGQVCTRSQGLGSLFGVEAGRSAANPSSMGLIPKGRDCGQEASLFKIIVF